jgi:hypothetical protein
MVSFEAHAERRYLEMRRDFMTHQANTRPQAKPYDCTYEHSLEHCLETRRLVEAAEDESDSSRQPVAIAAMAS